MKALTLTQPWATLVALGEKRIESRSWYTPHRGPLAIHAAKTWSRDDTLLCFEEPFKDALMRHGIRYPGELPLGAVVATCEVIDCIPTSRRSELEVYLTAQERDFGDFALGRFAWILDAIESLPEPIPARGALGVWEWQPSMLLGDLGMDGGSDL